MKKIIIILMCLLFASKALTQSGNYYSEAESAFAAGKYEIAKKLYNAAYVIDGIDTKNKQTNCDMCISALINARKATASGNPTGAKIAYELVLTYNPNDSEAKTYIRSNNSIASNSNSSSNAWENSCCFISLGGGQYLAVQKRISDKSSYDNAYKQAQASRLGGFSDWQLPTESQMRIIVSNNSSFRGEFWCNTGGWNTTSNTSYGQWWKHKKDANGYEYSQYVFYKHLTLSSYNTNSCSTRYLEDSYLKSSRSPNGGGIPKPTFVAECQYLIVREFRK